MFYFCELFNSNFFSSTLISFFILLHLFQKSISVTLMEGRRFPNVKVLPSGKYFILVDNGIYIYNSNFTLNKTITNFTNDECMNEEDYNKVNITEFVDDNNNFYIICLVKAQFLYIFESQREILYNWEINIKDSGKYYNLIPLKMEYPNFHYIISYISQTSNYKINLFHFRVNISQEDNNNNNELIYNKELSTNDKITISQEHLSCNKISGQKFICFYRKDQYNIAALILNETLEICKNQTKRIVHYIESIKSSSDIKKKIV